MRFLSTQISTQIDLSFASGLALLTLNRPTAKNALGAALLAQFKESLLKVRSNRLLE